MEKKICPTCRGNGYIWMAPKIKGNYLKTRFTNYPTELIVDTIQQCSHCDSEGEIPKNEVDQFRKQGVI